MGMDLPVVEEGELTSLQPGPQNFSYSRESQTARDLGKFKGQHQCPGMRNIWVLWVQPIPPPRLIKVSGSHHLSDKSQCSWTPCCSHGPSVIVRSRCLNLRDPARYKRTGTGLKVVQGQDCPRPELGSETHLRGQQRHSLPGAKWNIHFQ